MRTIDLPFNQGFRGDNLYYASSSMGIYSKLDQTFPDDDSKLEFHRKAASRASTPVGISSYIGKGMIDSDCGHRKFNRCIHTSYRGVSLGFGYWMKSYNATKYYYYAGFQKFALTGNPIANLQHLTLDANQAASRAWWTMQPRFEGQISLINFLIELKDVKNLLGQAYILVKSLNNLRKVTSKLSKNPKYDPSKPLASVYLEYEFGIKPLMRDLATIIGQLGQIVQVAQDTFKVRGLSGTTSHYSETLASTRSMTIGTNSNYYRGSGDETKTKFTATMRYNYDYKMRDSFEAFMKYWGLSGSIEAIWEATPFSFLVDYFIKIGKAIHAMEVDPNVKVFSTKYCESLRTTATSGEHLINDPRIITYCIDGEISSGGLVAGYRGTTYYRYPTSPSKGLYVPRLSSSVTDKQATNVAAVLRTLI